ncbi:hypothetical protein K438DRAFT_234950 [Mycena galopus ATCC 62051]|nr:hypothetical protein K438DRAFT_234950 [Mycena galopus ATCC 62051]
MLVLRAVPAQVCLALWILGGISVRRTLSLSASNPIPLGATPDVGFSQTANEPLAFLFQSHGLGGGVVRAGLSEGGARYDAAARKHTTRSGGFIVDLPLCFSLLAVPCFSAPAPALDPRLA